MKGQTAIEYLMTYGWAILIILIIAGVLVYYGIFLPNNLDKDKNITIINSIQQFCEIYINSTFGYNIRYICDIKE